VKTSELINRLIELKKAHGDVEVFAGPDDGNSDSAVGNVAYCDDWRGMREVGSQDPFIFLYHYIGGACSNCRRGVD